MSDVFVPPNSEELQALLDKANVAPDHWYDECARAISAIMVANTIDPDAVTHQIQELYGYRNPSNPDWVVQNFYFCLAQEIERGKDVENWIQSHWERLHSFSERLGRRLKAPSA
jgi:hypothetical protein